MIELNAGIHPELTGRENVWLLGAVMGLPRAEIRGKLDAIEDFCELGCWFELPVRTYSSGMLARLGFGVAMNIDADVLLVDEVLAVGDLRFQRKCYERMERLRANDVTVVFVSHSLRQVERLCNKGVLMGEGEVLLCGGATEVINVYSEQSYSDAMSDAARAPRAPGESFQGTGEMVIKGIDFLDPSGVPVKRVRTDDSLDIRFRFDACSRVESPVLAFGLVSADLLLVAAISNEDVPCRPSFQGSGSFTCRLSRLPLLPGLYSIRVKIIDRNGALVFGADDLARFLVIREEQAGLNLSRAGLVRLDVHWAESPIIENNTSVSPATTLPLMNS
jgi:hypothetical protein